MELAENGSLRTTSFQMIYFSWPSDRALSPFASIDVAILGSRASRNGFYLASLIQSLPPECPVCLVGHSHGTRVILLRACTCWAAVLLTGTALHVKPSNPGSLYSVRDRS